MNLKYILTLTIVLMCICTVSAKDPIKNVDEGVLDDKGKFEAQDIFATTDNLYIKVTGIGNNKTADIYIVLERNWTDGDAVANMTVRNSTKNITLSNNDVIRMWNASLIHGKYDVFVDMDQDGIYNLNKSDKDIVDSKKVNGDGMKIIGFEVLPELSTLALMILGITTLLAVKRA